MFTMTRYTKNGELMATPPFQFSYGNYSITINTGGAQREQNYAEWIQLAITQIENGDEPTALNKLRQGFRAQIGPGLSNDNPITTKTELRELLREMVQATRSVNRFAP